MELGEKLKEARLEKGLSLLDVQEKTKIQKRYLEAIEAGNYSSLPGSFYTRAFIREFALVVGIEPNALLEEHEAELPTTSEEDFDRLTRVQKNRKQNSTKNTAIFSIIPRLLTAILIIGIIAVVWYFLQKEVDPENEGPVEDPNKVEIQRGEEAINSGDNNQEEETDETEEAPETDTEPEATMEMEFVEIDETGTPSSVLEVTNTDELILTFETENNSWLDVKDMNGTALYSNNFTKDESPMEMDLSEDEYAYLNIGRAIDVTIKINGEPIEYPFDPSLASNFHQVIEVKVVK